jgi:hypothetical protein
LQLKVLSVLSSFLRLNNHFMYGSYVLKPFFKVPITKTSALAGNRIQIYIARFY